MFPDSSFPPPYTFMIGSCAISLQQGLIENKKKAQVNLEPIADNPLIYDTKDKRKAPLLIIRYGAFFNQFRPRSSTPGFDPGVSDPRRIWIADRWETRMPFSVH